MGTNILQAAGCSKPLECIYWLHSITSHSTGYFTGGHNLLVWHCSTVQGKAAAIFREEKAPLVDTHSCRNLGRHRRPQQYTMQQFTQLTYQVCRVWVTNSRQQSPSWEWPAPQPLNNFTTNMHYHAQRSLSLVCNLSQMNPVHSIPFYFLKFHYNIVLQVVISFMFPHHFSSTPRAPWFSPTLNFEKPGLCTDTHGPCCSVCVQTHMENAVQFVYRHTWTMLFSLCTDTHGPCCSVHKQSAGLLRLNKADLHQFAFRYSPFLTKLNKHQRILLAILYVMLRSATFLILFSNLTSTSYDDEDNKKCMCARAHIPFSWKYKILITCSWYKGTEGK